MTKKRKSSKKRTRTDSSRAVTTASKKINLKPILITLGIGIGAYLLLKPKTTEQDAANKAAMKSESPTAQATPQTVKIITGFDAGYGPNTYDFKYQDSRWYARPVGKDYWIDILYNLDDPDPEQVIAKLNSYKA